MSCSGWNSIIRAPKPFGAHEYEAALGVVLNDVSYDSSLGKFFVESFDALGDGDVILYGVPPCLTLLRHYAPP
jgi:hypothetical protein